MYYRFKKSLASISCALTLSVLPMTTNLSATDAALLAEHGGGHGGGGHSEGGYHHSEGNYHGNYSGEHSNYHPNAEHNNYNHNTYNYNQFDRNAWHGDVAGWGAGGIDVVPGEYVYPGNTTIVPGGDMNTLYDYESSTNQASPQ